MVFGIGSVVLPPGPGGFRIREIGVRGILGVPGERYSDGLLSGTSMCRVDCVTFNVATDGSERNTPWWVTMATGSWERPYFAGRS